MSGKNDDLGPPERALPQNVEAEQALLGAILIKNEIADRVAPILAVDDFFEPVHARIFAACLALIDRGQSANPTTLRALFEKDDALADIGGGDYLRALSGGTITLINAESYAQIIADKSQLRKLISAAEDASRAAFSPDVDEDAEVHVEALEQRLLGIRSSSIIRNVTISVAAERAIELTGDRAKRSGLAGVATPLDVMDRRFGGWHPGNMIVAGGRPGMGKTILADQNAWIAAKAEKELAEKEGRGPLPVVYFSLEMTVEELAQRRLSDISGIDLDLIETGKLDPAQFVSLIQAQDALDDVPLFYVDVTEITVAGIRARARRLSREFGGLLLAVVDHVGLIDPSKALRNQNRVSQMAEFTRGLKILAKETRAPVIVLSQLNRDLERRDNKRPMMADFRDSGTVEQDADYVFGLFREEYYLEKSEPTDKEGGDYINWEADMMRTRNRIEIIPLKRRQGKGGGPILAHFDGAHSRIQDLAGSLLIDERNPPPMKGDPFDVV